MIRIALDVLLYGPVKGIECKDAQVLVVISVAPTGD